MAVIIKKANGKPIFNTLNISEEEKQRAMKLDEILAKTIPQIEKEWEQKRMSKKYGRRINMKEAYRIGKKLAKIVDNENFVSPNERRWVWKAIREMYLSTNSIKTRGRTRDDLDYLYKASKFPFAFIKNFSWDSWRRLLDSPSVREDERFVKWIKEKVKNCGEVSRVFIRKFMNNLYAKIKNKDTTVFTDRELFNIYDTVWEMSLQEIQEDKT